MTLPRRRTVLSLCDFTGNMVRPWAAAGYDCYCFDMLHSCEREERVGEGIIRYCPIDLVRNRLYVQAAAAFAFPACTNGAVSGARWFKEKGLRGLLHYLELVEACRATLESSGGLWMLENPVSTLSTYWRKPDHSFHPFEYAGYEGGAGDTYPKKTCLWTGGGFVMPETKPLPPTDNRIHHMPPGERRGQVRSITPAGFARAVFEANSF